MRLLVVADGDPTDGRTWSGAPANAIAALTRLGCEVTPSKSHHVPAPIRFADRVIRKVTGRRDVLRTAYQARTVQREFQRTGSDYVLGFAVSGILAGVSRTAPCLHVSDCTTKLICDYYNLFTDVPPGQRNRMETHERTILRHAKKSFLTSDWARHSAIADYQADGEAVVVAPFGASLPPELFREDARERPPNADFLWCGVDWERKGGAIAVSAIEILRRRGFDARLVVVGCDPPDCDDKPHVVKRGFLSKANADGLKALEKAYSASVALLLPTRAEAFGMVFCEAAAASRPSIATRTGGIPTIIVDGETGFLVDLTAGAEEIADIAQALLSDPDHWSRTARAARARFEQLLNWDAWAETVVSSIRPNEFTLRPGALT